MKIYFFVAFIFLNVNVCLAQKPPKLQIGSFPPPQGLKIDGKLKEWPSLLKAYNPGTRLYYAITNDDSTLYVVIRGLGTRVTLKALQGGMTLLVSKSLKGAIKENSEGVTGLTFPLKQPRPSVISIMEPIREFSKYKNDTIANKHKIDSLEILSNKRLSSVLKELKINGAGDLRDSVISIYNELGIKAQASLWGRTPIFEIAIPLRILGVSIEKDRTLKYAIRLNGESTDPTIQQIVMNADSPDPDEMYLLIPTELVGEYTLYKKTL